MTQENPAVARDTRKYMTAAAFVLLILGLMAFLTFVTIPEKNKDLIVSIISMIVGGLSMALSLLFGKDDAEKLALQQQVAAQERQIATLTAQYTVLKSEYDRILLMLVQRHVVEGEGFVPPKG